MAEKTEVVGAETGFHETSAFVAEPQVEERYEEQPAEAQKEEPKPLDDFQKTLQGLRDRVTGMQLRPGETLRFNEALDRLEALR